MDGSACQQQAPDVYNRPPDRRAVPFLQWPAGQSD